VAVVAACVHDADGLAVPLSLLLGGERQIDLLGHGQRIHVGPQGDDRAWLLALQHCDDASVRHLEGKGREGKGREAQSASVVHVCCRPRAWAWHLRADDVEAQAGQVLSHDLYRRPHSKHSARG
jgi:hypothetical protein